MTAPGHHRTYSRVAFSVRFALNCGSPVADVRFSVDFVRFTPNF